MRPPIKDFTLQAYKSYILALERSIGRSVRMDAYMSGECNSGPFYVLRHDIDRRPKRALAMARVESDLGVVSTYYVRMKPGVFIPEILREIARLGHEVGFHYESLSDARGNHELALDYFAQDLQRLRDVTEVNTICMHGRPLLPYDNRDMWRSEARKRILREQFSIIGEVYLDINYQNLAYISDTGRNWKSGKNNIRDMVFSEIETEFDTGRAMLSYFSEAPHSPLVFQTHPERWADSVSGWAVQWLTDEAINFLKRGVNLLR